jgi:hypothetical protein
MLGMFVGATGGWIEIAVVNTLDSVDVSLGTLEILELVADAAGGGI